MKFNRSASGYAPLVGFVFIAWGFLNSALSIARYGLGSGMYFWFCNLALMATGYALIRRDRACLVAFLGVGSFTQVFWLIDNAFRMSTGRNLFGLVEFLYHPGLRMDEFVLSHYHYLILPTTLIALCVLPPRENDRRRTIGFVLALNFLIFGLSYFAFPDVQNVNCIHSPCFPTETDWHGAKYSIGFFLIVLSGNLLVSLAFDAFVRRFPLGSFAPYAAPAFVTLLLVSSTLTLVDVRYRGTLPSFVCEDSYEDAKVKIGCRYTLEEAPEVMRFVYRLENKSTIAGRCESRIVIDGNEQPLQAELEVGARSSREIAVLVPYPKKSQRVRLRASCAEESNPSTTDH